MYSVIPKPEYNKNSQNSPKRMHPKWRRANVLETVSSNPFQALWFVLLLIEAILAQKVTNKINAMLSHDKSQFGG